jgi:VCBS repeat-containing protein
MAFATPAVVMNVTGQAWIRNPDGSLSMLQAGSRIPPGAEMFTAPGASIAVRMEGGMPVPIGPDTQAVTDAPDAGRHEAPPSTAVAVPVEVEWSDRMPIVDAQSGSTQEDQAARAMANGDNDGGNSFVRVDRIVEMAGNPPLLGSQRVAPPAVDGALESRSAAPTAPRAGKAQAGKPLDAADPAAEKITVAHHAEAERGPREIRSMREARPAQNPENHISLLTDATVELTEDLDVDASTGRLTATGQLTIVDQDAGQDSFQPHARFDGSTGNGNAPLGSLAFDTDGSYSYTVDNARPELQALKAGERIVETYTVTSLDGSAASAITIVIHGTNDLPQLSSGTAELTEDRDVDANTGRLTTHGQLAIVDADAGQSGVQPHARFEGSTGNGNEPLGALVLHSDASYTYSVDNAHPAIQALDAGDRIVETYTATSLDGTTSSTINIVIQGARDTPRLSSGTSELTEDRDVDAATGLLTATGQLSITDQDAGQSRFQPEARFDGSTGNANAPLGTLVFNTDGSYTYTVDNGRPELQALKAGERIVETYTVTSLDGAATSTITIVIHGANDVPQLSSATSEITEDLDVDVATGMIGIKGQLTIADQDAGQDSFQPHARFDSSTGNGNAPLGTLVFSADGSYTYTVDNGRPELQALKAGERIVETYTVTSQDGSATSTITIVIHGANDVPQLSSRTSEITEDLDVDEATGSITAKGQLIIADQDAGQDSFQPQARFDGSTGNGNTPLGTLVFNTDGSYSYTVDNTKPEIQALKAGERIVETYTVTSQDGSATSTIAIAINGANDPADIKVRYMRHPFGRGGANDHGVVVEDETIRTSGTLQVRDVDAGEDRFIAQDRVAGLYGSFSMAENGSWHYLLNNDDPAVQALGAGHTMVERFTVSSLDGTALHTVTVTIKGSNDTPEIASSASAVTEDHDVADGQLTARGQVQIADRDEGESQFQAGARFEGSTGNANAPLGTLVFNPDGSYIYTVDNANEAVQALKAGEHIIETYTITSLDGTKTGSIAITLHGTDDGATITPHNPGDPRNPGSASDHGQVTEDVQDTTGGRLDIHDADAGQSRFVAQTLHAGNHGGFSIDESGNWTYKLANSAPAVQALGEGQTLTEKFTVSSVDGSAQHGVTVTIVGTNDIPTISGVSTGATTEDGASEVTGQLGVADVDIRDGHTWTVDGHPKGSHGYLAVDATGKWTYAVDAQATQALAAAQEAHDVFTVKTDDGHGGTATQTITVNITGTNDIPVITPHASGSDRGLVIEDARLSTQGKLDIADADQGQSSFKPQTVQDSYGTFTVDADGNWTYTLDSDHPAVQALSGNDTLGARTFTVTSQDGTTTHTVTVNIGGTNDAPTSADNAATVGLGQSHTFGIDEFAFSDSHGEHDRLQGVIITRTPESGRLTMNGQVVTQGGVIPAADIAAGKLVYNPGPDGKGTSFGFAVRDTGGTANAGRDTSGEYNFDMATHELVVGGNESSGDDGLPPLMGGAGDDVIVGDKGGVRTTTAPGKSYNIAFIVDVSDSMRHGLNNTSTPEPGQEKISLATAALTELLKELAKHPGDINVTVIAFDHEARTIASVSGLNTVNVEQIVAKIREMPATGGGTNCESGINMATAWFREQPTVDSAGNKRENIASLLSDGMPNRTNSLTDIDSGVQTLTQTLRASEALKEVSLFRPIAVGVPPSAEPFFRMLSGMPGDEVVKARAFRQTQISDPFEIKASYSPYGDESRPTVLHTAPVRLDMGSTLSFTVQSQPGSQDPYRWVLQRETRNGWEELYPEDGAYSRRDELTAQTRAVNEPGNYRLMFELHDQTPDDRDATITISALSRIDPTEITGPAGNILNVHNAADLQAGLNRGLIISERETPGDDTLFGTDGADIIFGDTPNTDALSWPGHPAGTHDGQGMDALADYLAATKGHSPTAEELYDYIRQHADTLNVRDDTHGGNDTIRGGKGDDSIHGQGGNDHLHGEAGRNFLHGGAGNDTLIAGDEGDVLIGGRDDDLMLGGQGSDSFRWEQGDHGTREAPAVDTIRNFSADAVARGSDVLDLRDLLGDPDEGDLTRYLHFTRDGNGTAIQVNTAGAGPGNGFDQKIMLENVDLTNNGMLQDAAIIKELMLKGTLLGEGQV